MALENNVTIFIRKTDELVKCTICVMNCSKPEESYGPINLSMARAGVEVKHWVSKCEFVEEKEREKRMYKQKVNVYCCMKENIEWEWNKRVYNNRKMKFGTATIIKHIFQPNSGPVIPANNCPPPIPRPTIKPKYPVADERILDGK